MFLEYDDFSQIRIKHYQVNGMKQMFQDAHLIYLLITL